MAEAVLGRGLSLPQLRLRAGEWAVAHAELVALASLMAAAAALRLWGLGDKALHHDESLHATFSWYLYDGKGYRHDPLMHGPFQFHVNALFYFLFGATDFTSRLPHALFGTAMVGMPYLLRKQIGFKAALIAGMLLAVSPTMLYFSRFDREDVYAAFWTLALVICLWRYIDEQRNVWLYGLAAALALGFATKELSFITAAILLLFADAALAIELAKRVDGAATSLTARTLRALILAPVAWLIAVTWPLLGARPFARERLPPIGDVLIVVGTLALPQFSAAIQELRFLGFEDKGYNVASEDRLRVVTVFALIVAGAYVGLLWRPRVWLLCAAAFYVPFILLFTTFFSNQPFPWESDFWDGRGGFFSGMWGSLDYWLPQHEVRRGTQPQYYYALLTPLYEFLPLLIAMAGAVWLAKRGMMQRWLLFWLAGMFLGLTVAGEKMPWLEMHIALPLILIAAILLARALDVLRFDARAWLSAAVVAASTGAAVVLLVDGEGITHTLGALVGAMLLGWLASTALKEAGNQSFRRGALVMAVAALFALTVRASITLSFKNEDTPVEMLVYTQTSPEIVDLVDRIDTLARTSGLGHSLPIVVDSQDGYSWPWAWYLRDYHEVSYVEMSERPYDPPANAVLLVHTANAYRIDAAGYSQTPYRHRWWFTEEGYRSIEAKGCAEPKGLLKQLACDVTLDASPARVFDGLTDGFGSLSRFFFHRRPVAPGTVGSTDGVAFFPESLSAFDASPAPPAEPTALPDGRIVFGRPGARPGEFRQPADVFVDAAGNIWVADSRNDRVEKFDATGRLLAALGRGGTNLASFREPWSVAVDSQGFVYVADTWAHRVQKFSPALEFVVSWGEPGSAASPGPLELYGPRDIAIGADGTLWLTDTGNKRLLRFSPDGEPLGAFGREGSALGEFSEPVGLAFDAAGNLYVADAWNGRVQRFSQGLAGPVSFDVGWRSQDILHKPYLAVLTDGRLLVSDPENGRLLLFDAAGRKLGAWTPTPDSLPVGVAASPDGGFVFSDTRRSEVQIVPGALVDSLFK